MLIGYNIYKRLTEQPNLLNNFLEKFSTADSINPEERGNLEIELGNLETVDNLLTASPATINREVSRQLIARATCMACLQCGECSRYTITVPRL